MTKQEAWQIIDHCSSWNITQEGSTPEENSIFNFKRAALAQAWKVIGEAA